MRVAYHKEYGLPGVLQLREMDKPIPGDNEILIKIDSVAINYGDLVARNFGNLKASQFNMPAILLVPSKLMFGYNKPKKGILGSEFSGVVEKVGNNVTKFKVGESIFGYSGQKMGANAEYLCMNENDIIAHKPSNLNFEEAATIPYGGATALNVLRNIKVSQGDNVLIIGASGSIGSHALQLIKKSGAQVTGVCSTNMVNFVKILGADKVVDYKSEDYLQSNERYDLVFDVLGKGSYSSIKKILKPNGTYLLASFKLKKVLQMLWTSLFSKQKVKCILSNYKNDDLIQIKNMVEGGIIRSNIDKIFPIEEIVSAHKYMESGERKGNVVLKFN